VYTHAAAAAAVAQNVSYSSSSSSSVTHAGRLQSKEIEAFAVLRAEGVREGQAEG